MKKHNLRDIQLPDGAYSVKYTSDYFVTRDIVEEKLGDCYKAIAKARREIQEYKNSIAKLLTELDNDD